MNPVFQATPAMADFRSLDERGDKEIVVDKWYFWTETWAGIEGPYETKHEAEAACKAYAAQL